MREPASPARSVRVEEVRYQDPVLKDSEPAVSRLTMRVEEQYSTTVLIFSERH